MSKRARLQTKRGGVPYSNVPAREERRWVLDTRTGRLCGTADDQRLLASPGHVASCTLCTCDPPAPPWPPLAAHLRL